MVPAGNKAKSLSSVNHTTKAIHHHHQGPAVCHNLIFDIQWWTAYKGASLIFEKLVSRSGFYDTVCFSILTSRPSFGCYYCFRECFAKVKY